MSDWIDVTRVLVDGMVGWPGDPPFRIRRVADIEWKNGSKLPWTLENQEIEGAGIEGHGARVSEIHTSAHIGTHLDAPLHCLVGGGDVASVGLSQLCGSAVVVEVSGLGGVTPDDLSAADIRAGDRVLLRMEEDRGLGLGARGEGAENRGQGLGVRDEGSGAARGTAKQFEEAGLGARGEEGEEDAEASTEGVKGEKGGRGEEGGKMVSAAFVTVEAARWLIGRGVVLVGVDSMSPDPVDSHDLPVHHALLGAGVPILEGLDLRGVAAGRYEMVALPLPIRGCEASPARVILRRG